MPGFFDLYRGATLPSSTIKLLGQVQSGDAVGQALTRRRDALSVAVSTGAVKSSQLGPNDLSILGLGLPPQTQQVVDQWQNNKGGGGVGGLISNLGNDVFNFGKEIVPGIYTAVKSGAEDVSNFVTPNPKYGESHFLKNVVDPTLASYKQTYAGGGGFSGFLHRLYQHPLGPALDVATLASLGAGSAARLGSVLARGTELDSAVGRFGSRLSRITSREGRAPVDLGNDVSFDRFYSPRPLAKGLQVVGDKIVDVAPEQLQLQKVRALRASRRYTRDEYQMKQHMTAQALRESLPPLEEAFKALDPNESTALHLVLRGVNTPGRLESFENLMRKSLAGENPEGHNISDFLGSDRRHTEYLANLPSEVKDLALQPNEAMIHAAEEWGQQVARGHELLGITPEQHAAAVAQPGELLDEHVGVPHEEPGWEGVIHHYTMPSAAEAIRSGGFNEQLFGTGIGSMHGAGIYGTPEPLPHELARNYGHDMVGLHVHLHHPLRDEALIRQWSDEARTLFPDATANVQRARYIRDKAVAAGYDGAIIPGHGEMRPPEVVVYDPHKARVLDPTEDWNAIPRRDVPAEDRAIDPNYVPDRDIAGLKWHDPNLLARELLGRQAGFQRRGPEGRVDTGAVTAQNLLTSKVPTFQRTSSGATFAAGAFRTDPRVFLDHVAQREAHVIDKAYKQSLVRKMAAKGEDADGQITELKFKTQDEVRNKLGADWVLVHPEFPIAWFRAEKNVLKEALNIGKKLVDEGLAPGDAAFEHALDTLASADAQAFIRTHWGAMKRDGVAVPKDFFEYQRALATVNDPFKHSFGKIYSRYINLWRTYTLTYMPRWALNTAAGTFLQAMVHGTINPRDYMLAHKIDVAGDLPPGVKLGREAINEDIGPQRMGVLERVSGVRLPTRQLIEGVQAIEDHFRRAMFVKSLRHEDKVRLNEMGESVKSWYEKGTTDEERIRHMLMDPKLVKNALDDVNRFAYNYSHLGPFERKWVRQFIPFWGWYKFISKLAWRLPLEYPGRSRVISFLSNVGLDQQDALGPIPDWLKGIIPLNLLGGHLNYLSTIGINPFSQFANPIAPHGAVNGILQLGQFSPVIQALEQAYGLDPLTGDSVRISPQEHVARDLLGRLIDTRTGEQVSPVSVDAFPRGIMALLNAFPQIRLGIKYGVEGGGSSYPESIPYIHERPMAPSAPGATTGLLGELGAATGMLPKVYDLGKYQQLRQSMQQYAITRNRSDLRRLSRKLAGQAP